MFSRSRSLAVTCRLARPRHSHQLPLALTTSRILITPIYAKLTPTQPPTFTSCIHSRSFFSTPSLRTAAPSHSSNSSPSTPSDSTSTHPPKLYTGITGLDVVPNAREVLIGLYEETIKIAQAYGSNNYNKHIIKLCSYRLRLVNENATIPAIEEAIQSGQVEELIIQAEDELDLLVTMNEEIKPWEGDPEGDKEFAATSYPMFGEKPHMYDLTLDDSCWTEVDQQLGYGKDGKKTKLE